MQFGLSEVHVEHKTSGNEGNSPDHDKKLAGPNRSTKNTPVTLSSSSGICQQNEIHSEIMEGILLLLLISLPLYKTVIL